MSEETTGRVVWLIVTYFCFVFTCWLSWYFWHLGYHTLAIAPPMVLIPVTLTYSLVQYGRGRQRSG